MKAKLFFFSILITVRLISNGQEVEPIFPYNHPSLPTIFAFANGSSDKSVAYKRYMIDAVNIGLRDTSYKVSTLDEIQSHLYFEEVTRLEGSYINSGWWIPKKKMKQSVGHYYHGFGWVYKIGTYVMDLLKEDCANALITQVIRIKLPEAPPAKKVEYNPNLFRSTVTLPNSTFTPTFVENKNIPYKAAEVKGKRTWFGRNWPWLVGIVGGGVASYFIFDKKATEAPHGSGPGGRYDSGGTGNGAGPGGRGG